MTAPTLTEFLLARIAEDEDIARGMDVRIDGSKTRLDSRTTINSDGLTYAGMWACRFPAARVLAECEAKRRIVRWALETSPEADYGDVDNTNDGQVWAFGLALQSLAAAYADHPDYRDGWKHPGYREDW